MKNGIFRIFSPSPPPEEWREREPVDEGFRLALRLLLLATCGALMLFSSIYLHLSPQLPSVDVLKDVKLQTPMRIYSREGDLIGQFGEKKRNPLSYSAIPPRFTEALLAAEDDGFFDHVGIDFMGLARAVSELVITGEKQSGGSTLTMQVARNYFLSLERTFVRKFKEILLSLSIERVLDKEEIFEIYFNQMFLGHRAYGFEAAAQVYYGAPIGDLDLAQLAMLAGLPKAPSRFNPISNPERALIRRNWILERMHSLDYISRAEYLQAVSQSVSASHHGARLAFDAPYAAEMARLEIVKKYGVGAYDDGYHVYTTISSRLQPAANQAISDGLDGYDARHGYRGAEGNLPPRPDEYMLPEWLKQLSQMPSVSGREPAIVTWISDTDIGVLLGDGSLDSVNWDNGLSEARLFIDEDRRGPPPDSPADLFRVGDIIRLRRDREDSLYLTQIPVAQAALVSLDPDNGAIISLVGGMGFSQSKFNRATQATRQPGSSFKPFVYSAALENGFTAASIINDAPLVFEDAALEDIWRPENDSGKFYGPTRLRWALTKSRNLVSIRLLHQLGVDKAIDYTSRFGFDSEKMAPNLSLALGSHAVTPLQLATAYASLANGGYHVEPHLIERVEDFNREIIFKARPLTVCKDCGEPADEVEIVAIEDIDETLSLEDILSQSGESESPRAPRTMDERVAFIIDSILRDVITQGTGTRARVLGRSDIAGKTGTTNGPTDAWFSGYNPDVVTVTWVGFDQNLPLGRIEFGGSAALPIWIDFMRTALGDSPERSRAIPEGIVSVRIDPTTGLLARPGQRGAIFEYFRVENVPTVSSGTVRR